MTTISSADTVREIWIITSSDHVVSVRYFRYSAMMPRIKQNIVLTFAKDLKAFLRFDAGLGRSIPDDPEELLRRRGQRITSLQQKLRGRTDKLEQGSGGKANPPRELREEKESKRRFETAPRRRLDGEPGAGEIAEHTHALPEPDESISKGQRFLTLISSLKPGRMLDLGAAHGFYSLAAAQLGWEVTAVDARTTLTPDPEIEKDPKRAELIREVRWVEADVREFPIQSGEYDLICILGLLHHLEMDDQPKLLKRCSDTLTLLAARVAQDVVVTEGNYEGLYFQEPGKTQEERAQYNWASWGNELAFRHTEESLIRMLRDCGYGTVMSMRPPHAPNYTFYLCLPSE